mgnify:CR=1 FL=1
MVPVRFDSHIRAIELRRDLASVADLIDLCFADHMDAEGRDYIRHVRQIARGLGNFFAEGTTPENSQLPFHGYLWEENGMIVGNLTLIQVRKIDRRTYLIANVAVHPDWRGRGIGRQLTERAIAHVRAHEGQKIHLQVRADNPSAIHIYQELGFEEMTRRTTWIPAKDHAMNIVPGRDVQVTKRRREEWPQQKEWLRDIYPYSLTWNLPFSMERLIPGFWNWLHIFLNGGNLRGWSALINNRNIGTAVWESGFSGCDYVWLGAAADHEDEVIASLVPTALRTVKRPDRININYPAGRAISAFREAGMVEEHTLIWMIKTILPNDGIDR